MQHIYYIPKYLYRFLIQVFLGRQFYLVLKKDLSKSLLKYNGSQDMLDSDSEVLPTAKKEDGNWEEGEQKNLFLIKIKKFVETQFHK